MGDEEGRIAGTTVPVGKGVCLMDFTPPPPIAAVMLTQALAEGNDWVPMEDLAHVLWHYGRGGYAPGSGHAAVLDAISKCDGQRRELLGKGFPTYVGLCYLAEAYADGTPMMVASYERLVAAGRAAS